MSIEQKISDAIEVEGNRITQRNKDDVARQLAQVFNLDKEEVLESLEETEYNNLFSTGNVYWVIHNGRLYWRPMLDSSQEIDIFGIENLWKLYNHIKRSPSTFKFWKKNR